MRLRKSSILSKPSSGAGFSLLELMVAMAVLGIIVTLALPAFRDTVLNSRVKVASYDLYTTMVYARGEAAKANMDVTITQAGGGWQNGWRVTNATGVTLRTQPGFRSIDIASAVSSITFLKSGQANIASGVTFTLEVAGNANVSKRCVLLDPGGRPKVLTDINRNGNCYDG